MESLPCIENWWMFAGLLRRHGAAVDPDSSWIAEFCSDSCSESHRRVSGFKLFKQKLQELNRREGCSQDEDTEKKPMNRTTDNYCIHFPKYMIDKFPNLLHAFAIFCPTFI